MNSALSHIYKNDIKYHPERVTNYSKYENTFDWSKINFPVSLNDIDKIEKLIDYGINVFGYEKNAFPLHISNRKDDKIINLLLFGTMIEQ